MNRYFLIVALALFLIPSSAAASPLGTWFDPIHVEIQPTQSQLFQQETESLMRIMDRESALRAQYGNTGFYSSCMRSSDFLSKSGGLDASLALLSLETCLQRQASFERARQQRAQTQNCPTGTYAQNDVCIQVVQQAPALIPTPVPVSTPAPQPKSNDQICKDNLGAHIIWNGKMNSEGALECDCIVGYEWNGEACVLTPKELPQAQPEHEVAPTLNSFSASLPMDDNNIFSQRPVTATTGEETPRAKLGAFEKFMLVLRAVALLIP